MRRASVALSMDETEILERLGKTLRLARLRRNLSQEEVATRAGVSRKTYLAMEAGEPNASLGLLARALTVLGYADKLGALVAEDPIGEDLEAVHGRRRAAAHHGVASF